MDDTRQGNETGAEGTSARDTQTTASPTAATGKRHANDTQDDADGSDDGTQGKGNDVADGTARNADTMAGRHDDNTSDDEAVLAEQHAEHSKHASMRALIRILLLGIIAIAVVFAIALATGNVGSGSTNVTDSDVVGTQLNNAASNETGNGTGNTQGTNAAITTTDGTCSDSGSENASGCDGKSDGTHGYEGLSDRQAALLDEVGTDTVLQGIEQGRTFVALFGYASCPDCKAAVPLLLDTAIDAGISQVLYVDTRANPAWESNTDIDGYDDLVRVMGDRFSTDDDGKPHMQVPFVVFVRNGTIVASVEGDDGLSKADSVHSDTIGQALVRKYEAGFKAMLGD